MKKKYAVLALVMMFTSQLLFAQNILEGTPINTPDNIPGKSVKASNMDTRFKVDSTDTYDHLDIKNQMKLYPNPAEEMTTISYSSSQTGTIDVQIFDLSGTNVKKTKTFIAEGNNRIDLDVSKLQSGLYFVSIAFKGTKTTKKLIIK